MNYNQFQSINPGLKEIFPYSFIIYMNYIYNNKIFSKVLFSIKR